MLKRGFSIQQGAYLALLFAFILLSACTPVKPWEKGILAKSHMAFEPDPLEARFRGHIHDSREGSSGGYGVGGGGCGCK